MSKENWTLVYLIPCSVNKGPGDKPFLQVEMLRQVTDQDQCNLRPQLSIINYYSFHVLLKCNEDMTA